MSLRFAYIFIFLAVFLAIDFQPVFAVSPNSAPPPFQLAIWTDIGLRKTLRGYWFDAKNNSLPVDQAPTRTEINNAKQIITHHYRANTLYLFYSHQYPFETYKEVMMHWKYAKVYPAQSEPVIVPTLVLQDFSTDMNCNFTNTELSQHLEFLKNNINSNAIGIYDVIGGQTNPKRSNFCNQLPLIQQHYHGKEIVYVGIQPEENIIPPLTMGVQDTYSGVSAGQNNDAWKSDECNGKSKLEEWVTNRISQQARIVWDLVIVGYDYDVEKPCGEDRFSLDHPVPNGRNLLAHNSIVAQYPGGGSHSLWSGFAYDLNIIALHSAAKDPDPFPNDTILPFYEDLKQGKIYSGYFKDPLNEITNIFLNYNPRPSDYTPYFSDVPMSHIAFHAIESLKESGFIVGCSNNPNLYCPDSKLTRVQIALLLLKAKHGSNYTPPAPTGVFADVPTSHPQAAWIEALYAQRISSGCGGGNFCPNGNVNRAQMASLLLRTIHGSNYTPPAPTGVFADVPTSHPQAAWIEALYAQRISSGCEGGNFCPNQVINRDQGAVLLYNAFLSDASSNSPQLPRSGNRNNSLLPDTSPSPSPQNKPGDLNGDGVVNLFDFNLLVTKFGNPYTIFDFNDIVRNYEK